MNTHDHDVSMRVSQKFKSLTQQPTGLPFEQSHFKNQMPLTIKKSKESFDFELTPGERETRDIVTDSSRTGTQLAFGLHMPKIDDALKTLGQAKQRRKDNQQISVQFIDKIRSSQPSRELKVRANKKRLTLVKETEGEYPQHEDHSHSRDKLLLLPGRQTSDESRICNQKRHACKDERGAHLEARQSDKTSHGHASGLFNKKIAVARAKSFEASANESHSAFEGTQSNSPNKRVGKVFSVVDQIQP